VVSVGVMVRRPLTQCGLQSLSEGLYPNRACYLTEDNAHHAERAQSDHRLRLVEAAREVPPSNNEAKSGRPNDRVAGTTIPGSLARRRPAFELGIWQLHTEVACRSSKLR
jgi:hypothetical protein